MTSQNQSLAEEPELRTQTLSPVSPIPVAFSKPSNIPILENQMDSAMSENSTYPGTGNTPSPDDQKSVDAIYATEEAAGDSGPTQTGTEEAAQDWAPSDQQTQFVMAQESELIEQQQQQSQRMEETAFNRMQESTEYGVDSQAQVTYVQPSVDVPEHMEAPDDGQAAATTAQNDHDTSTQQTSVDIQALLDNIVNNASSSNVPASDLNAASASKSPSVPTPLPNGDSANLPPRPPTQDNNSGLNGSDVSPLHAPGVSTSASQQGVGAPGTGQSPFANGALALSTSGPPGTAASANNLPPPPMATFQQHSPPTGQSLQQSPASDERHHESEVLQLNEDDVQHHERWSVETQRKYDAFLIEERDYVSRGEWDKFPANSRLFIGNLPTEKVTKRDLFHVFHKYGALAQVSIKQAYGFIQFLIAQDCLRALDTEQNVSIRGRQIHLEISKPQRNKNQGGRDSRQRRSRSPDNRNRATIDRYRGGDNRRQRSPSPRSRNRYGRRRSRSRSPQHGRRRESHQSDFDDDCPLPRRSPHDVPDLQIIAKDNPDRNFISYVEKAFEARGIKVNVLLLSPKLPESSVMRRQIIEGVLAVMKLDRTVQMMNKFQLSVFDRSQGANNVRFEEYTNLDLNVCVELVLRAKQTAKPPMPQYGNAHTGPYGLPIATPQQQQQQRFAPPPQQPYYGYQSSRPQSHPPPPQQPPSQFSGMDPNSIQSLLSRVQQNTSQQQQQSPYGAPAQSPDLSRLLASANVGGGGGGQQQQPYPPLQQQQNSLPPNLQALLGNVQQHQQPQNQHSQQYPQYQQRPPQQSPQPPPQHQQQQQYQNQQGHQQGQGGQLPQADMKSIMAGLARWKG